MDLKKDIADRVEKGLIDETCMPLKCESCGCVDFEMYDVMACQYGYTEYKVKCKKCQQPVGYWAYGAWVLW